jgi:hypothetical protein
MPFDFGFDFRLSAGYVTDPAYAVGVLGGATHAYPFTFTNGNGVSINAGWVTNTYDRTDRVSTGDPRLAGTNAIDASTPPRDFKIDLASGSAPGAGGYTVALAAGDPGGFGPYIALAVKDNTTAFITLPYQNVGSTNMIDATGTVRSLANWPSLNTPVSRTFASTTCVVSVSDGTGSSGQMACLVHFRLIQVDAGISGTGTLAPPASALAGTALEVFTGSGTVAAPASALAAAGLEQFTGSASLALPVSVPAGAGLVSVIAISGSGGVAPAVSALEAYGNNGAIIVGGGGGGGIGRHWFYQPLPRLRPELLPPPPEPITGRGAVRAPVSQVQGTGRVIVLGRGLVLGQATEIRSDGQVVFVGRGAVRRRVASTRGAGFVGFPDDDIFGLELEELDLELA